MSRKPRPVAYTKGFQDGKNGRGFDPITEDCDDSVSAGGSGGGFSFSKLMSMLMVGGMVYQLGGGGR